MTSEMHPESGLSGSQAAQRLAEDGPNSLPHDNYRTLGRIVLDTATEPMFLLLLLASTLYLLLGELQEGLVLLGMVCVSLGLTLYQEGKTERAVQALRDLSSPRARVIRDAQVQSVAGSALVRGDLILLSEGDRVPADAMLLSDSELQVDESLLTGESVPVQKMVDDERAAALYSGTLVVQGQGRARVTATGSRSEMGRIGSTLQALQNETSPLKKQTARLVLRFAWLAMVLSSLLVLVHWLTRGDWLQAMLAGIAFAMTLLPHEFTVVMTVLPALGAWRLARQQVLTRRITAIETLGATSVLCVDKTGTLTHNRMTVAQLHAGGADLALDDAAPTALPEQFHALVEYAILASRADPFDPMEQAFHHLGQQFLADTEHLHRDWTLVHEYSLSAELRAMTQVWAAREGARHVVAAKGSPEAIGDLCHLDSGPQQALAAAVDAMAARGLRVLAVARAHFSGPPWPHQMHDFEFEFLGLLGLADPLREEIPQAVRECHEAGIRLVMITGDYALTARAIAQQAGLPAGPVLTGDALAALSDAELQQKMKTVSVCARIAPDQKLRIVQAFKADGAVVAMTGDGVNDAPALKAAHVGVAMGGRGTDVAREASTLVLQDDNFASIVRAVRLGRRIFDNLQKSMSYILAVHVPIAGAALLPVLLGWPIVLYPMHIVFLELVIDPACALVFENEPAQADVMQHPPRDPNAPLFAGSTLLQALWQGLGVLFAVMVVYAWGLSHLGETEARGLAFAMLVLGNLALIFSNRSRSASMRAWLMVPNTVLWVVVGLTLLLLMLVLHVPLLASAMHLAPLTAPAWALAGAVVLACLFWFEVLKWLRP